MMVTGPAFGLCGALNRAGLPCWRAPRRGGAYCPSHDPLTWCQAQVAGGEQCNNPRLHEDLVPGVALCWNHAAKLIMETRRAPTWATVRKMQTTGRLRLVQ